MFRRDLTPSRRRWFILAVIFAALALNYFDRQIVSVLKPTLKAEFDIDDRGYATIVNVFAVCYAASYPVMGWLVDRLGVRLMMLLGIVVWSTACIGTGLTQSIAAFLLFRGVLGIAEPAAYPAQLRAVAAWFPGTLRATANSICQAGSSVGAVAAPPLVAWLTLNFNWHAAFIVPGFIGFGIAAVWWAIYRDSPTEANKKSTSAVSASEAFTWPQLWRTRTLWGILICRFISDPVWYFCLFWLPGYLQEESGLSLEQIGMMGWIPFLAADLGAIGTSAWSDRLVRRGIDPLRARKIMLTAVAGFAPLCALTPHLESPWAVIVVFSIIAAMCLSWLFTFGVIAAESFPAANVGGVIGIAAGCGAAGAIVFNTLLGRAKDSFDMTTMFTLMAVLHPLAALLLWATVRREQPQQAKS